MINRREALNRLGGLMALGIFGEAAKAGANAAADSATSSTAAKTTSSGPITIAHITDVHVYDEREAEKWLATCLHSIQSHAAKPSLILNTGDSVMDTLNTDRSRADLLWRLWNNTLKNENSLPIHHCLGNHDVWGLGVQDLAAVKSDPLYGKKLGLDGFGIERSYYSFDEGGWHFVALDSIKPDTTTESKWVGMLDDEQFAWLENDLKTTPADRPVLVYSHIPILQVASFKHIKPTEGRDYLMSNQRMMGDARRIIDLFNKHPNVKLCLSGHLHLEDRVELSGVTYICAGSVSGRWWQGTHIDSAPGYTLLTLHPDGRFEDRYESYGWAGDPAKA